MSYSDQIKVRGGIGILFGQGFNGFLSRAV